MRNKVLINIIAVIITAIICAAITTVAVICTKNLEKEIDIHKVAGTDGAEVAAYRMEDLPGLNEIRYVNYTADEFLLPSSQVSGEIIDLTAHPYFEGSGTLQFVFLDLDPSDENLSEKLSALEPYLRGDNAWHFTLYLPSLTGACNIYVNDKYLCSSGEISGYDFTEYSEYGGYTNRHITEAEPFYVDLGFDAHKQAMSSDITECATVVTVHFEAAQGKSAHFTALPSAGDSEKVVFDIYVDRTALIIASVVASLIFAVFLFAAILKRTLKFLPSTFAAAGILGFTFFTQILYTACPFPYTASIFTGFFAALIPFSAICGLREKIRKFPVWIPFAVFGAATCVLSAFTPPFTAAIYGLINIICCTVTALMTITLTGIAAMRTKNRGELITPIFSAAFILTHVYSRERSLIMSTPQIWMCAALLLVIVVLGIALFVQMERRNRFLTTNLKNEVERQTTELRNIIEDRDKLLQYLSHDMKKPAARAQQLLGILKLNENNKEKLKVINDAENKIHSINAGLADLQYYAKQNFASELTTSVDAGEIISYVYQSLQPDCEAQGVHMYVDNTAIKAFAKRNMLISVLNNLVFNALEHAECSVIRLYAESKLKYCRIFVSDDGKGLENKQDAFRPYYSEANSNENLGLGLYLCRQLMQSMGGDLTYERQGKKTLFIASIPLSSEK